MIPRYRPCTDVESKYIVDRIIIGFAIARLFDAVGCIAWFHWGSQFGYTFGATRPCDEDHVFLEGAASMIGIER